MLKEVNIISLLLLLLLLVVVVVVVQLKELIFEDVMVGAGTDREGLFEVVLVEI